jgi:hypothetical protein
MMLLREWVRRRCPAMFAPSRWLLQACRFCAGADARPAQGVDQAKLDGLLDEYDRARDEGERERIASDIYDLVGEKIESIYPDQ